MTISISTLTDLNTLKRYEGMRDAPRRFLETGVFPNGEQALIASWPSTGSATRRPRGDR